MLTEIGRKKCSLRRGLEVISVGRVVRRRNTRRFAWQYIINTFNDFVISLNSRLVRATIYSQFSFSTLYVRLSISTDQPRFPVTTQLFCWSD